MKKRTELLATAGSLDELVRVIEAGADAVQIGDSRYGMRLPGSIAPQEWAKAAALAHERSARVYVVVNAILDNRMLDELPAYVRMASESGVDAIVFGDPAVLMAAREAGVSMAFHWNPEMTATNYVTANYWGTKGATRAILARELNLEQILDFKRNCHLEVQVQVHGLTNIFHSKRRMVSNYFDHQSSAKGSGDPSQAVSTGIDRGLYVMEEERPDERYPIHEDEGGTHIMSAEDLCMIENIHELLEGGIDSLKIEGLLKSDAYNETVIRAYRQALDAYEADPEGYEFKQEWLTAIERVQPQERPLSYGFFYKEQVY